MVESARNPTLSYEEPSKALDRTPTPPPYITGGCLCGKVRYRAEIGKKYAWPPGVRAVLGGAILNSAFLSTYSDKISATCLLLYPLS